MNKIKNNLPILICFWIISLIPISAQANSITHRDDVQQFIDQMVKQHQFKKPSLIKLFDQVVLQQRVKKAISSPAEAKPWYKYRSIFLTQSRIKGGVKFWRKHSEILSETEKRFGVPPEMITAIIGVETRYAMHTGGFRVIDSLSTLAFNYPKRSKFFRKELEQFLLLSREEKMNPLNLMGSYAGAMGIPQFMPSSYRHYAADFEGDGRKDIWNNTADVIASVANYFAIHGWKRGEQVALPAITQGNQYKNIIGKTLKLKNTLAELKKQGVSLKGSSQFAPETAAQLLSLQQKNSTEEWVVLNNFYVITRYNHSNLYAMAVHQLSQEIKSAFNR